MHNAPDGLETADARRLKARYEESRRKPRYCKCGTRLRYSNPEPVCDPCADTKRDEEGCITFTSVSESAKKRGRPRKVRIAEETGVENRGRRKGQTLDEYHFLPGLYPLYQELGPSTYKLAEAIYMNPSTVRAYVNGKSRAKLSVAIKIADYYHVPVDQLLAKDAEVVAV